MAMPNPSEKQPQIQPVKPLGVACNDAVDCQPPNVLVQDANGCWVCMPPSTAGQDGGGDSSGGDGSGGGGCSAGGTPCPPCNQPGGTGGGSPTGGVPGGSPTCSPCIRHDGTVVDSQTNQPIDPDPSPGGSSGGQPPTGGVKPPILRNPKPVTIQQARANLSDAVAHALSTTPTYCGVPIDQIPYCDDVTKDCPKPADKPVPEKCDDCISKALKNIADAINKLANKAADCFDDYGNLTQACLDKIIKQILDKIIPPSKNCDEYCGRLKLGLVSATEQATTKLNCTCQSCVDSCTGDKEGACCTTCGSKNCTCKDYKCVDNEQQKKQWLGWCNAVTGEVFAGTDQSPPDGSGQWKLAGDGDTYEQAFTLAQNNCQYNPQQKPPEDKPVYYVPPTISEGLLNASCDTAHYTSRIAAMNYLHGLTPPVITTSILTGFASSAKSAISTLGLVEGAGVILGTVMGNAIGATAGAALAADLIVSVAGCDSEAVKKYIQSKSVLAAASHFTGIDVNTLGLPLDYALNAACRPKLPSPQQAVSAWLSNAITDKDVDTFYAAAGLCEAAAIMDRQSSKAKPVPAELIRMRRWNAIGESDYSEGMRQLGYVDKSTVDSLWNVSFVLPSLGEILHMMIRDADNAPIVERFHFDDRFEDKFGPQLKDWCEKQGISTDVVRMAYRSHWDIPSKTELFSFWQRFRNSDPNSPEHISIDDLKAALTHNNVMPFWFDKYLAASYRLMNRIDIRRSYQLGTLTDDDARAALSKLGYDDNTTDILMHYLARLKSDAAVKHPAIRAWLALEYTSVQVKAAMEKDAYTNDQIEQAMDLASIKFAESPIAKAFAHGDITVAQFVSDLQTAGLTEPDYTAVLKKISYSAKYDDAIKLYEAGTITRDVANQRMIERGIDERVSTERLDRVDDLIDAKRAINCTKSIKRKFTTGELDAHQANQSLTDLGVVKDRADVLVQGWQCEIKSKSKSQTVSMLITRMVRGALAPSDLQDQLINLGYKEVDANDIVLDALAKANTQQAADEAKRLKQKQADEAKKAAAAKRTLSEGQKLADKAERARTAKAKKAESRQASLLHAARLVINSCSCDVATATRIVGDAIDKSMQLYGLSFDEALQSAVQAAEGWIGGQPDSYSQLALSLSELTANRALELLTET